MEVRVVLTLNLLISVSLLCLKARAESSRSLVFIDEASHKYIRNQPLDGAESTDKGKIVGVVIYRRDPTTFLEPMLDVTYPSRVSQWLEEASPADEAIMEVLLVRQSLAWITGIILLISTLIGVHLLLNMPLTMDTLLYSNVKLDRSLKHKVGS